MKLIKYFQPLAVMSVATLPAPTIYRHEFSPDTLEAISHFAAVHRYDEPAQFKDNWKKWIETQEELITVESRRLRENRYTGDVKDKMYKSARYYFKNKSIEKPPLRKRRKYTPLSKELLATMDEHISHTVRNSVKPADGYASFATSAKPALDAETRTLLDGNKLTESEIPDKFKKTYKNRYFTISRSA